VSPCNGFHDQQLTLWFLLSTYVPPVNG